VPPSRRPCAAFHAQHGETAADSDKLSELLALVRFAGVWLQKYSAAEVQIPAP